MRKQIKTFAGWIHTTLILAIITPFLYAVFVEDQTAGIPHLYLKCLVIVLPAVITDFASNRCRNLFSYLMVSALTLAVTGVAANALAGSLRSNSLLWGYFLLILIESLFIIIKRLSARLHRKAEKEAAKAADPFFHPFYDILKEPSFLVLVYFGIIYIVALNFNSPSVCNAALFSVIVYIPVTFLYQYVSKIEAYLSLNKRTCRLPSKRIYMIRGCVLAIYLLVLLLFALPSLFTISHRHYHDLRKINIDMEPTDTGLLPEPNPELAGEDLFSSMLAEHGEQTPPPWWIDFIFQIITILIFFVLAIALLKKIYIVFQNFRTAIDENGDLVEELQDTDTNMQKIKGSADRHRLSEKERVRKEYRRVIRRHRKDRPAIYESPSEIEDKAGIAGAEETVTLHAQYELARYGPE